MAIELMRCARRPRGVLGALRIIVAATVFSWLIQGCAVGPDFKKPEMSLPQGWIEASPLAIGAASWEKGQKELARWWEIFQDPLLSSLVERAVESNLDLKVAETRIAQARALRAAAAGSLGQGGRLR